MSLRLERIGTLGTSFLAPKFMIWFQRFSNQLGQEVSALLRSCNPTISIIGSDGEGRKPTAS